MTQKTLMIYFFRFFCPILFDLCPFVQKVSEWNPHNSDSFEHMFAEKTACHLNYSIWKFDKNFVTLNKSVIICPNLFDFYLFFKKRE